MPSKKPKQKSHSEEIKRWMKLAVDDLDSAKVNFNSGQYYVSVFLSQQAVEKALKAIILKNSRRIIKIHDLVLLGKKADLPKEFIEKCEKLNGVYIDTRYGDIGGKLPSQKYKRENSLEFLDCKRNSKMVRKQDLIFLRKFKRELSDEIPIEKIYLFGSRAKGKIREWSDFDLIIVSKAFENKESYERAVGFHKYWNLDYPVDFLCYTPEEFNKLKNQITIVRTAVKEGVEI